MGARQGEVSVAVPTNHDTSRWSGGVRLFHMPHWLPPLAAATFAVLLLNIALIVQRVRERSESWPAQFLRDLRHCDGRLPDDHDKHIHT